MATLDTVARLRGFGYDTAVEKILELVAAQKEISVSDVGELPLGTALEGEALRECMELDQMVNAT